jgi:hypothetical protein
MDLFWVASDRQKISTANKDLLSYLKEKRKGKCVDVFLKK